MCDSITAGIATAVASDPMALNLCIGTAPDIAPLIVDALQSHRAVAGGVAKADSEYRR